MTARTWRKEPVHSAGGTSWRLVAGRAADRIRVGLGRIAEDQAEFARRTMQAAEIDGTAARVLALFEEDPGKALLYLTGAGAAAVLPEAQIDYGAMTVTDYFDQVFWPERSNPSTDFGVAASTAATELGFWRNVSAGRGILDGELGRVRLRDLTDQHWVRWDEAQSQLSGRSRALRRAAYSALLSYARKHGHTTFRPEFFRIKGSTKRTRPQTDPLSIDEVRALLAAADPVRRCMWAVGVGQGLRPGELVLVEWGDIDWTDRVLRVRGTKTEDAAAVVPLTPFAFLELQELWMRVGQPSEGPCFTYKGRRVAEFKKALAADAKAAGIGRHVYPYLLRHSFATLAWALGVPKDAARRVMRHTDEAMLDQVYCRPRPADLVERVAAFVVG